MLPTNELYLKMWITGAESLLVGTIASLYKKSSVLLALLQTGVATGGLTIFAFQKVCLPSDILTQAYLTTDLARDVCGH